jgi:hypothetical protein
VVGNTSVNNNGADAINSIAFADGSCANADIGGHFTSATARPAC